MLCADKSISLSEMVMVTFNGVAPDPEKIDVCIADGDTRAWVFPLPVTTAMLVHMYLREKGGGRGWKWWAAGGGYSRPVPGVRGRLQATPTSVPALSLSLKWLAVISPTTRRLYLFIQTRLKDVSVSGDSRDLAEAEAGAIGASTISSLHCTSGRFVTSAGRASPALCSSLLYWDCAELVSIAMVRVRETRSDSVVVSRKRSLISKTPFLILLIF